MEQSKLVEKLNKDVADYIAQLPQKKYEDGWPEDRWEEEMEKHPMFMTKPVSDTADDLPPLVEALRQLKYDPEENSPDELAKALKQDGNHHFALRKYRWAVDCYTKGLEIEGVSDLVKSQLYSNRATAQYHQGNFRKALRDSTEAKKYRPDYMKAHIRGAMCCLQLSEFADAIAWCNEGLKYENDPSLVNMKKKAEEQKKVADRNRRKAIVQEAKKKKEFEQLIKIIQERGIHLADGKLDQCEVKPKHPALANARVHLDGEKLVWPVVFMYPEYGTTDYIQEFHEDSKFMDHLNVMFNKKNPPGWDKCRHYVAENLQVYFSDNDYIIPVDRNQTLRQTLQHKRYKVHGGTPHFLITVTDSKFDRAFRKKNHVTK